MIVIQRDCCDIVSKGWIENKKLCSACFGALFVSCNSVHLIRDQLLGLGQAPRKVKVVFKAEQTPFAAR